MVLESSISNPFDRRPAQSILEHLLEDTRPPLEFERLTLQTRRGTDGVERTIGTNRRGVQVYLRDETGEWDSTDGTRWVRRETNGTRIWHGRVGFDRDNNFITESRNSGVRYVTRPDGSYTASFTRGGIAYEMSFTRDGAPTRCRIGDRAWTAGDNGNTWTNERTGQVWRGRCGLDGYGQYWEHPQGGERTITARSDQLEFIQRRQAQLTERYGVVFPRPGEQIRYSGRDYTSRPPTMEELDCLENVLRRNGQMNTRGLRICFVQSSSATDRSGLWGVYQRTGNDGGPQVVLMPRATATVHGWNALEGTIEHELVHHEQYNQWGRHEWGSASSPAASRDLLRGMGWVYDAESGRSRILDRDGGQWQYNYGSGNWEPIIAGHPEPARAITAAQMRDRARVRPATNYFTAPGEMHAEALAMFRQSRRMLFTESPELYETIRRWDQELINSRYGLQDGQPRMIRGIDGRIVPNTPENRRAVENAERDWRRRPDLPPLPRGLCLAREMHCGCERCQV